MKPHVLRVSRTGPIQEAEVFFGDLTVLVGPQATGKSIFLQLLKLLVDSRPVLAHLKRYGLHWQKSAAEFLDVYLGEGMGGVWREGTSRISLDDQDVNLRDLAARPNRSQDEAVFYIPAQRVLTLREGWPRPFSDYSPGDPFVVRDFSEKLRMVLEGGSLPDRGLFPWAGGLTKDLRDLLAESLFSGFGLHVDERGRQKRLVLRASERTDSLPFMVWSAGQREFVPLLLGLYGLFPNLLGPPARVSRRSRLQWVIIEELEAGLHPKAISAVLLLVLQLLARGYRVCLSTHSPHVLDLVWALKAIQSHKAAAAKLLDVFGVPRTARLKSLAQTVLAKEARVFYFDPTERRATEISRLDPGASNAAEAGWGGLSEFSGRAADVVADVIAGEE